MRPEFSELGTALSGPLGPSGLLSQADIEQISIIVVTKAVLKRIDVLPIVMIKSNDITISKCRR